VRAFIVAAAAPVLLAPAAAQTPPSPASASNQSSQPTKDKSERTICESTVETGSRVATNRICRTASEWKEHQLQTQGALDQFHMNTQQRGGSPH